MRVRLDLCASRSCGAGALKHGDFRFERVWPKREGGGDGVAPRYVALVRTLHEGTFIEYHVIVV